MCLNLSPSVSWGLVGPWVILALREWRLLVTRGAAARRVRAGVVVGRISILLVKLADALAISPVRKIGQKSLMRLEADSNQLAMTLWLKNKQKKHLNLLIFCDFCKVRMASSWSYPRYYWKEGESDNSPSSIAYNSQGWRSLWPLVGQVTEADEPQERPDTCWEYNILEVMLNMMEAFI